MTSLKRQEFLQWLSRVVPWLSLSRCQNQHPGYAPIVDKVHCQSHDIVFPRRMVSAGRDSSERSGFATKSALMIFLVLLFSTSSFRPAIDLRSSPRNSFPPPSRLPAATFPVILRSIALSASSPRDHVPLMKTVMSVTMLISALPSSKSFTTTA